MNFPKIAHDDHPITEAQLRWIQTNPEIAEKKEGTFICQIFKMPEELGTIPSALYGPSAGDSKVKESEVTYIVRGERNEKSRMIDKPIRPAQNICVIGLVGQVAFTLYGTQAPDPTPREPWDKGLKSTEEKEEASKFWSEHALSQHEV